jgi:hypothetical protein
MRVHASTLYCSATDIMIETAELEIYLSAAAELNAGSSTAPNYADSSVSPSLNFDALATVGGSFTVGVSRLREPCLPNSISAP